MTYQAIRWCLLLLLFLDWSDLLDLAEDASLSAREACAMAPLVFFPLALRYREEVVRRIRLCYQRWQANHVLPPVSFHLPHPVLTASPSGLRNVDMVRLQP